MGQYWLRDPACRGVHCAGPIITEVFNNAVSSGTSQGFDFKVSLLLSAPPVRQMSS